MPVEVPLRLMPLLLALTACTGGPASDAPSDTDLDTESGYPTDVRFAVRAGDQAVACDTDIVGLGLGSDTVRLRDLRFFVYDLVFSGPSGEGNFLPDASPWQSITLGLLDFENGEGDCAATGDPRTNDRLTGFIPEGDWDTLSFRVGVPFDRNHLDPASQDPPLDVPDMFWTWQGGYKFFRADLQVVGAETPGWNTHLGSAGCASTSAQTPPDACDRPNRAKVSVPFDPFEDDLVVLDLQRLFGGVDLGANAGGPPGCMVDVADTAECAPIFEALGMVYGSGQCENDCIGQRAFLGE